MNIKISFIIIFLFPSLLWAQVDTLRPASDKDGVEWDGYNCDGSEYMCIDEATADEHTTYLYTSTIGEKQGFGISRFHPQGKLDSVEMVIRTWIGRPIFYDDFNDNSLDSEKWTTRIWTAGSVTEQNQRLELDLSGAGFSGPGLFTTPKFAQTDTFTMTFDWYSNWAEGHAADGYDGIFIICGDSTDAPAGDCVGYGWDKYYGAPTVGVFFRVGRGCNYNYDGIGIHADDDGEGTNCWECSWDQTVDQIASTFLDSNTWYDGRIYYNGGSGLCSLIIEMAGDDSIVTGTVSSTYLDILGDSIRIQFHVAGNNDAAKYDWYDNIELGTADGCTLLFSQGTAIWNLCADVDTGLALLYNAYANYSHVWDKTCDGSDWDWHVLNNSAQIWMFKTFGVAGQRRVTQAFLIAHWTPYKLNPIVSTGDLEAVVDSGTLRRVVDGSP